MSAELDHSSVEVAASPGTRRLSAVSISPAAVRFPGVRSGPDLGTYKRVGATTNLPAWYLTTGVLIRKHAGPCGRSPGTGPTNPLHMAGPPAYRDTGAEDGLGGRQMLRPPTENDDCSKEALPVAGFETF